MIYLIKKASAITLILILALLIMVPLHAHDDNDTSIVKDAPVKTYTDLNDKINCTQGELHLNESYKYDCASDENLTDGVMISKNMTVIGHNSSIDGSGLARGVTIDYNCNVVFENMTFINGYSNSNGGGIYLRDNSTLLLKNCVFTNNKVYNSNGGAVYAHYKTSLEIQNCIFSDNVAIRESDLDWEEFKRGMGSAICQSIGSNLTITDSVIRNNTAYLSSVLLVSFTQGIYDLSTLVIKNCLLENNTSEGGGVVYLDELGAGQITDTIFRYNNMTQRSGVLVLDASIHALVKNCLFDSNTANNGGAMHIKLYEEYPANVTIQDCNFTNNTAREQGGVIYSNRGMVSINNSIFADNRCSGKGGAIITTHGSINITDSVFIRNSAEYGGALSLINDHILISNVSFIENTARVSGGAVYSKSENVTALNCTYINNTAPEAEDVYGVYKAYLTVHSSYYDDVNLTVMLDSAWMMPLNQTVQLKFKGKKTYTTEWLKMDSNGTLNLKVPLDLNVDTYTLTISMGSGACQLNQSTLKVAKMPCKLAASKMTTTYKSGKSFKIYVKNSSTGKYVKGVKLTVKVYTGKKYVKYTLTTDKNGKVKFSTSKFGVGTHKVIVTCDDSNIKLSKLTTSVKIKKASGKLSYPKTVKKSSKIKITVKNKASGKPVKKNKFTVKVYTGKKVKTYKIKSSSKGIIKVPTKKLAKGKHKITVSLKNSCYSIYKKFSVKIK